MNKGQQATLEARLDLIDRLIEEYYISDSVRRCEIVAKLRRIRAIKVLEKIGTCVSSDNEL